MRIFNKDKTKELNWSDCDPLRGSIEDNTLTIHHQATAPVQEVGHYETIKEYPNGGKDVEWVVDIKGVEGHEAYDEIEEIKIYIPYPENKLRIMDCENEISECEEWLYTHDYIGTKIATGRATIEEYADIIAEMNAKANRINELRSQIEELED